MKDYVLGGLGQARSEISWLDAYALALHLGEVCSCTWIERAPSGDHLVGDHAERIDVARRCYFLAAKLFGRHVIDCAGGDRGSNGAPCHDRLFDLSNSKIHYLH